MPNDEVQGFSDIDKTLKLFRITDKETSAIRAYAKEANLYVKPFIDDFYRWIPNVPEFKVLFSRPGLIEQVKNKQTEYWKELFNCKLDSAYFHSRYQVGNVHAKINLPISSYVAGMSFSTDWWLTKINEKKSEDIAFLVGALTKLFALDTAIICASYSESSNRLIEQQSRALMELSTPTIQLWEDILVLPILGVLDSKRTQDMTDIMLNKILETGSRSIIIDITGVPTVDSSVAGHLIKITKATKLMGCECILSGIGPEIAQTLVHIGINLESIDTSANLKSAISNGLG